MTSKPSAPVEIVAPFEVRATRYDLRKLRLVQVMVPLALILFPVARRLDSLFVAVPAAAT